MSESVDYAWPEGRRRAPKPAAVSPVMVWASTSDRWTSTTRSRRGPGSTPARSIHSSRRGRRYRVIPTPWRRSTERLIEISSCTSLRRSSVQPCALSPSPRGALRAATASSRTTSKPTSSPKDHKARSSRSPGRVQRAVSIVLAQQLLDLAVGDLLPAVVAAGVELGHHAAGNRGSRRGRRPRRTRQLQQTDSSPLLRRSRPRGVVIGDRAGSCGACAAGGRVDRAVVGSGVRRPGTRRG